LYDFGIKRFFSLKETFFSILFYNINLIKL
jgi:hypothetical protein